MNLEIYIFPVDGYLIGAIKGFPMSAKGKTSEEIEEKLLTGYNAYHNYMNKKGKV